MCCESCPDYEECAINNRLRNKCCDKCPDYNVCFGNDKPEEEDETWEE